MSKILVKNEKKEKVYFRNKALAENSKISYRGGVNQYLKFIKDSGEEINPESVKKWIKEIKKSKSPATFNLRVQSLKDFLMKKFENDHKQLFGIYDLFKGIKRAKLEKAVLKDAYLTYEQVEELSNKMTVKLSLIMQTLFWTGARVGELINIKQNDVKLNGKAILKIKSGKGNKEKTVYLPLSIYNSILIVFRSKEYLFETKSGKQYHKVNVHKEIKRQAKRYGFDIHPHTLRHSKAMYLKDVKKLTPDQIAKALGHASVATTLEYYFHGTPSAKDQGIEDVGIE